METIILFYGMVTQDMMLTHGEKFVFSEGAKNSFVTALNQIINAV